MVDFSRELPTLGYVMKLPKEFEDDERVWCNECYEEGAISGDLFVEEIKKGQFRAGNRRCDDCGALV